MKVLLIQHGEKLALLLVLVICAWWIMSVSGDPASLPTEKVSDRPSIEKKISRGFAVAGGTNRWLQRRY